MAEETTTDERVEDQAAPDQEAPREATAEPENVQDLPEWAQRLIRDTRREAAEARTHRKAEQEQADARVKAILQAAGIETGDADEDPVKAAAAAREKAESDARQARLELAVHRAASGVNGDPAALLDSRAFLARVSDIDPDDREAITSAIRDAIKDSPRLAATQAADRSSADFTGGTSGSSANSKYKTGMSIVDAIAADGMR